MQKSSMLLANRKSGTDLVLKHLFILIWYSLWPILPNIWDSTYKTYINSYLLKEFYFNLTKILTIFTKKCACKEKKLDAKQFFFVLNIIYACISVKICIVIDKKIRKIIALCHILHKKLILSLMNTVPATFKVS